MTVVTSRCGRQRRCRSLPNDLTAGDREGVGRDPRRRLPQRWTRLKSDSSPVTAADEAARSRHPGGARARRARYPGRFGRIAARVRRRSGPVSSWSIRSTAPREFLAGRNEYTVNIALVRDGVPVVGWSRRLRLGSSGAAIVGRGAERLDFAGDTSGSPASCPNPRATMARGQAGRGGQPLASSIRRAQSFWQRFGPVEAARLRLRAEILPARGRCGRHLSAACPDLRVGCRGRPRVVLGGRRRRTDAEGGAAHVTGAPRTSVSRDLLPGAIRRGDARQAVYCGRSSMHLRPAAFGGGERSCRIGHEGRARLFACGTDRAARRAGPRAAGGRASRRRAQSPIGS